MIETFATHLDIIFLVKLIKHFLHGGPKSFLPLEDCLFGHNVWRNVGFKTPLEEQMRQLLNIVIWIVVHNANIVVISQITLVHHERRFTVLWDVGSQEGSLSNLCIQELKRTVAFRLTKSEATHY